MVDTSIRDPRAYELMAIFLPDLSDEDVGEQIERVSGYLTSQNATITNVNIDSPWGRRRIAYTIRFNSVDYRDGIYVVIHFEAVPSAITEIERELKLDTRVMRYLLVLNDPTVAEDEEADADGETAEAETIEAPEAASTTTDGAETEATAAVATDETEAAAAEADAATEEADAAAAEADVATDEAEAAAEEAEAVTDEAEAAKEEADVAAEDAAPESTDETEDSKKED